MIKAVIFDFDGTIIDTETPWFEIYRTILKEDYHYDLTLEEFVKIVGTTNGALFDVIDQALDTPIDRKLFHEKTKLQYEQIKNNLTLREGFLEILEQLKNNDVKLAIASSSSKKWVEGFLQKFGLIDYFPVIRTADDVDEVKPNPALYMTALEALQMKPDEVIAVEDSANGSLAAIRAGINCLIIPNNVTKLLTFHEKAKIIHAYEDFNLEKYMRKKTWGV